MHSMNKVYIWLEFKSGMYSVLMHKWEYILQLRCELFIEKELDADEDMLSRLSNIACYKYV